MRAPRGGDEAGRKGPSNTKILGLHVFSSEFISGKLNRFESDVLYFPIKYLNGSNNGAILKNTFLSLFLFVLLIFLIRQLYRFLLSSFDLFTLDIYHL